MNWTGDFSANFEEATTDIFEDALEHLKFSKLNLEDAYCDGTKLLEKESIFKG